MQRKIEKQCPDCGKTALMWPLQERCDSCRIVRVRNQALARYRRNRPEILAQQKEGRKEQRAKREEAKKSLVNWIKTPQGYGWSARFYSPKTGHWVTLEAEEVFPTLEAAHKDYVKAMG